MATGCCGSMNDKIKAINWKNVALRLFPIATWLPKYNIKRDLRYDMIAGLTVGLTAVPQSLAYAQLGNIAPQYGLYSCFMGMIIYCFMGTSKDASVGPSALLSMLSGQIIASAMPIYLLETGDPTCSTLLAFMSGILLMLMGVTKLGFLVSLFSVPVVSGFTSASGFVIAASQFATLVGLKTPLVKPPGVVIRQIVYLFENITAIRPYDAILGVVSIAFLFTMQFLPKMTQKIIEKVQLSRNPKLSPKELLKSNLLCAILMETVHMMSAARNVILFGVAIPLSYFLIASRPDVQITVVGKIPAGFPPMKIPQFYLTNKTGDIHLVDPWGQPHVVSKAEPAVLKPALDLLEQLAAGVVIISLMASLEMFAIEKALGRKNGYRVNASQELLCIGLANFLQGFLSGISVTTAVARCALNDLCRVKTQLSSLISASIVMLTIGLLTDIVQYIPKAALSAVIISAAINLIEFSILKVLWKTHRQDFAIFMATFILCLFYDIAYGIIICLLINLITFLRPAVKMRMFVDFKPMNVQDSQEKQVAVVRLPQGMKYPSADKFSDKITTILQNLKEKYVLIDCQFVTGIDYTGLQAFSGLLLAAIELDKRVMFANVSENLAMKLVKMGVGDSFRMAPTVEDAVSKYVHPVSRVSSLQSTPPGSDILPITAFEGDKRNVRLISQLSVEPSFFGDIPITVGNIGLRTHPENAEDPESVDLTSVIIQAQSDKDFKEVVAKKSPEKDEPSPEPEQTPSSSSSPEHFHLQKASPSSSSVSWSSPLESALKTPDRPSPPTHKTVAMKLLGSEGKPIMRRMTSEQAAAATAASDKSRESKLATSATSNSEPPYYQVRRSTISGIASLSYPETSSAPVQPHISAPSAASPLTRSPPATAPIVSRRETDL